MTVDWFKDWINTCMHVTMQPHLCNHCLRHIVWQPGGVARGRWVVENVAGVRHHVRSTIDYTISFFFVTDSNWSRLLSVYFFVCLIICTEASIFVFCNKESPRNKWLGLACNAWLFLPSHGSYPGGTRVHRPHSLVGSCALICEYIWYLIYVRMKVSVWK